MTGVFELLSAGLTEVPACLRNTLSFQMGNLTTVRLTGSCLTELPVDTLVRLNELCTVDLSFNAIARIPDTVGRLSGNKSLTELRLHDNQLFKNRRGRP